MSAATSRSVCLSETKEWTEHLVETTSGKLMALLVNPGSKPTSRPLHRLRVAGHCVLLAA